MQGTAQQPLQQQQQQQGVLPALFGFQLGPGQGYMEALTPEQQHQVRVEGVACCPSHCVAPKSGVKWGK
jgi:hypothetical protein